MAYQQRKVETKIYVNFDMNMICIWYSIHEIKGESGLGVKTGNTQSSTSICNGYKFDLKWICF